jgi:protein-S-isoprenylcysteine O-methyltransferase Ste14
MTDLMADPLAASLLWLHANLLVYLCVFSAALYINCNFNTVMVGATYLLPLIPIGLTPENAPRFLMTSFQNTMFGIIEVVIFVITVRKSDITFDKDHVRQLLGHVLPITAALVGLSFVSRASADPMSRAELAAITAVFLFGSVMRVIAVYQIGSAAFKFDIAFRDEQRLKTDQLYAHMRHPSYTAMMIVILAYALNTHCWIAGILGTLCGWLGFQYRIHYEEKALAEKFGAAYLEYRAKTPMWLPGWRG